MSSQLAVRSPHPAMSSEKSCCTNKPLIIESAKYKRCDKQVFFAVRHICLSTIGGRPKLRRCFLLGAVEVNAHCPCRFRWFTQWLWIEHPTFQLRVGRSRKVTTVWGHYNCSLPVLVVKKNFDSNKGQKRPRPSFIDFVRFCIVSNSTYNVLKFLFRIFILGKGNEL